MSLLLVENVTKRYGAEDVLRGVRLQLDPGQKVGLVGRNGGGKSTLLRLIEGLERPDGGRITLRKGAGLGHVPQIPSFEPGQTARAYVEGGLAEAHELARQVTLAAERMGEVEGDALQRAMREHERLSTRLELAGGWELDGDSCEPPPIWWSLGSFSGLVGRGDGRGMWSRAGTLESLGRLPSLPTSRRPS